MEMSARNSLCSIQTDINLVEQILEQGQRLRAAMVQTILNNDPFNLDIVKTRNFKSYSESDTLKPMYTINVNDQHETKSLSLEEKHKFLAYLRGEKMTRIDERKVLDNFKAMSNTDICDATERSYNSDYSCCCDTCKAYYKHSLSCDFNHCSTVSCKDRHNIPPLNLNKHTKFGLNANELHNQIGASHSLPRHIADCLKYVDSLKISVHSLLLNQEGNKKVYGNSLDKKLKLPTSITHTYFVEYQIPEIIIKSVLRSKSKVDSGLDSHNLVRMCSNKLHNEAIYFKQISLHDISSLSEIDLATVNIKFQVSCRTLKQKQGNILGYAMLNMASFLNSRHLSLNQNLLIMLNSDAPIVIGTLKVSLQLGCGQLYFGKEFIDAIYSNKENIKNNTSDSENSDVQFELKHQNTQASLLPKDVEFCDKNYEIVNKNNLSASRNVCQDGIEKTSTHDASPIKEVKGDMKDLPKQNSIKEKNLAPKKITIPDLRTHDKDKEILFGFICVGEAQFVRTKDNTFVTCQPFSQDDVLYSRLVHTSSNPYYNFNQVLPFVYDESFLNKLRDNYMVFEFWEKVDNQENLIGISKVPLHQFYVAFRNPVITKYLNRNKLPVIGCDRWEPICNPLNGEIYGQVQILVALGTDVQVHNLKLERGFESDSVSARSPHPIITQQPLSRNSVVNGAQSSRDVRVIKEKLDNSTGKKQNFKSQKSDSEESPIKRKISAKNKQANVKKTSATKHNLVDVAIQSDVNMADSQDNIKVNMTQSSDALGVFLTQLMQQKQRSYVENSTNTEREQNTNIERSNIPLESAEVDNMKVRRTADLLDSLQQALSVNKVPEPGRHTLNHIDTFKAHVVIENALHLPCRKKCTVRAGKGRTELLPSPYVSFETSTDFKVTKIVQENKNPEWDYSCDVELPVDLLINNQKRLIFKVWKKLVNLPPFEPNFESDTVLGFAALDLTVLLAGMPTVSGWYNIVDFSNKCNGQIKISVTPLENLDRFKRYKVPFSTSIETNPALSMVVDNPPEKIQINPVDEPGELLSRALKRKFTELDEITQRLKLRLSRVTNDGSDTSNDEMTDEFERDINNLCVEEDYDTINFEDETPMAQTQRASGALLQIQNSNFIYAKDDEIPLLSFTNQFHSNQSSSAAQFDNNMKNINSITVDVQNADNSTTASSVNMESNNHGLSNIGFVGHLDKQLIEGRQKIDSLLEKLSLLNHNEAEIFDNRYVSGCSTKQDCSKPISVDILEDIRKDVDPISTDISSDNNSTANINTAYVYKKPFDLLCSSSTSSNSGLLTGYSEHRLAPDGAGNPPDDKNKPINIVNSAGI